MTDQLPACPFCHAEVALTKAGEYRVHGPKADRCEGGGTTPVYPKHSDSLRSQPSTPHQHLGTMQLALEAASGGQDRTEVDAAGQQGWREVDGAMVAPATIENVVRAKRMGVETLIVGDFALTEKPVGQLDTPERPWETCDRCNTDTHVCGGCGAPLEHGVEVCAECDVRIKADMEAEDQELLRLAPAPVEYGDWGTCPGEGGVLIAPATPDITARRVAAEAKAAADALETVARRRRPATPAWTGAQRIDSLGADAFMGGRECADVLAAYLNRGWTRWACDVESEGKTGILARSLKAVIFSPRPTGDIAVVLDPRDPYQADLVRWMFDSVDELVFHNSPFDVPNLAMNGLFTPEHAAKVTDTLIWARGAEPSVTMSKTLGEVGARYLGTSTADGLALAMKAGGFRSKEDWFLNADLNMPFYARGAATDAVITARVVGPVRDAYARRLTNHPFADWGTTGDETQRLIEREQRLNRMSLRRTCKGYEVDLGFLDEFNGKYGAKIDMAEGKLKEFGIRPTVAQDLLGALDRQGLIPEGYPTTKATGALSGSKEHLPMLGAPLAQLFLWHKEQVHVLKDYLEKMRDLAIEIGGRYYIFPTTNYFGATTGRMSMGNPPVHQFPGSARGMLLGRWSSIDWSQIEPVTIANVAGQLDVLHGYEHEGKKFYTVVEEMTGIPYKQAKAQLLGTLYGQGKLLTAAKLGVDVPRALEIKQAIFAPLPKIEALTRTLREIGDEHQLVPTVSGRITPIPSGYYEGRFSVQTHKAINYFVQGSAYDVLAECALSVEEAGLGDYVHLLMHDEMVVSTEAAPEIRKLMEVPPARLVLAAGRTPILHTDMADLGERWAAA